MFTYRFPSLPQKNKSKFGHGSNILRKHRGPFYYDIQIGNPSDDNARKIIVLTRGLPLDHPREPRYEPYSREQIFNNFEKNIIILKFDFYLGKAPTFYEKRNDILILKEIVCSNLYQNHYEGERLVISGIFRKAYEKLKKC